MPDSEGKIRPQPDPLDKPTQGRHKLEKFPKQRPAIAAARALPFPEWSMHNVKIRNLEGKLVPFILNPIQRRVDVEWERQMNAHGYVRMIILKARKEGVSSYVQNKIFRSVLEREGWHAAVLAHDDAGSQAVFDRTRDYVESLPRHMKRALKKWNKKEIAFTEPHRSALRVNAAKARGGFGRGSDYHMVHLSELAFWPAIRGQSGAQGQATAIINSIPRVPGSAVVIESTANGVGNEFYQFWVDALDGKNGFTPLFLSWLDFPEYRIDGKAPRHFPTEPDWEAEEPRLEAIGASSEQLAWRRWKIANDCRGDIDTFHQEYPSTWEEAFLASGRPVFDVLKVKARYSEIERRERIEATPRWRFDNAGILEESQFGELRFFGVIDRSDPDRFAITADPAGSGVQTNAPGSKERGDPACAYVWDRTRNEQVAEWNGHADAEEFALVLCHLGGLYGRPLVIPEAGPWGGHVVSTMLRLGYPSIYFREQIGEQYLTTPTSWTQLGWVTSHHTKPQMVEALRALWRDGRILVNSLECCSEHLTFVARGQKRVEAQSGCHDDRVICCAIYALWSIEHPYVPREVERELRIDPLSPAALIEAAESGVGADRTIRGKRL